MVPAPIEETPVAVAEVTKTEINGFKPDVAQEMEVEPRMSLDAIMGEPVIDGPLDAPIIDGPLDEPVIDGPVVDGPVVDAHVVDGPAVDAPVETAPAANGHTGTAKKSKYDEIPGPLGLASASLEGKVALVTGAGKLLFHSLLFAAKRTPNPNLQIDSVTLLLDLGLGMGGWGEMTPRKVRGPTGESELSSKVVQ
jgi:hypothetical protein